MRLSANQLDMLYRIALAEFFTCPSAQPKYDRGDVIAGLMKRGLAHWENGVRLTDAGRAALKLLSDDQRAQLEKINARKGL